MIQLNKAELKALEESKQKIMKAKSEMPTQFAPAERASQEAIRADYERLQQMPLLRYFMDAMPDPMLVLNKQRQAVLANRAMLELIQMDNEQAVLGQRVGELVNCEHARESEGGCGTTDYCRQCGAVHAMLGSLQGRHEVEECRISQPQGAALDLRVWGTPLNLDEESYSIFSFKDISHEKRRRALERIFFHDIMNTASIVSMYAELFQMEPEEVKTLNADFQNAVKRLIEEINAQRHLSAAENDELAVTAEPIDPAELLATLAGQQMHHEVARDKQVVVMPNLPSVEFVSDWALLGRVLGNMIKNALEASLPGELVKVGYHVTPNETITFYVSNPSYIPRKVQLQIFQRSFSTKGAGRGLGTYSMKLLSERYLKGMVRFESDEERGTTFYAKYPLIWHSE